MNGEYRRMFYGGYRGRRLTRAHAEMEKLDGKVSIERKNTVKETVENLAIQMGNRPGGGVIRIADFNFDMNGDGKLDPFERKVMQTLKSADTDGSGTLTTAEFVSVLKTLADAEKTKSELSRKVKFLVALVVVLIGALLATSIVGAVVGGESIKENRNPDCSDGTNPLCNPSNVVRVGIVESYIPSFFDLPAVPTEQLKELKDLTFYIDMTADPNEGGVVEATFKIAGAYKGSSTSATIVTSNNYKIKLDSAAGSGTITMNGATFPVLDALPSTQSGRALETHDVMYPLVSAKQLAEHVEEHRKLFFSGSLMTSGSFTMMASTGLGRRALGEAHAAHCKLSLEVQHLRPELAEQRIKEHRKLLFMGSLMTLGSSS